ncbi:MAG: CDP-glycerol glycerophosphotransferase family protein, partial [Methanobrevibacter sp.]|nr:CDP-glycerol glycerophosphotransferase family protein [Methanobrevibacter sp.]
PETVKSLLIYLKNDEFHIDVNNNEVYLKSKDYTINALHNELLVFDIVEIIGSSLNFSTYFTSSCDYEYFRMEAIKVNSDGSKETYDGKFFDYPTTNRYPLESVGLCWKFDYCVDFKIPIDKNEVSRIYFKLIYDEDGKHAEIHNPIQFQNYDAGLSKVCNYLIKDNQMVIYNRTDESFYIQPYSFVKSAKLEVVSILKMIKDHNSSMFSGIFYHLLYLFMYPFMRGKRIWLFQDRVDIADDNAKHLFRYAIKKDDGIKKYYVIRKDCDDFKEMKKIDKHIVPLGSFKNKFLYLFAEKMISSHVNHSWLNPFFNPKRPYYNGFLTLEKCFLQHGVIKDDLSSWLRKFFQNLHLFLTSSDYERNSILGDTYNYEPEVVQAFGLPRHDNLKFGVAKKEILFSPTWRKHLVNRQAFEKSEYYYRLNSFLNNERLLKSVREKGYKIVFKPHYDLEPFLDLFTLSDEIEVNTHDSYQTIFNNSAVMITDYSSVFFDFSFLKKPVIYYHEGNDYHYDEGYFSYEEMGFGDVIDNEDNLVDKIIEYMENGCEMEEKYKNRVDKFFKYTDQKNCKRVYDWLYEN